jgi:mannose-1-phosphate guanylyltransferase
MPALYPKLERLGQALMAGDPIEPIWQEISPESIDVGIMEKAQKVAVVPVDIGWNDVGSWAAIYEISQVDKNNNAIIGGDHLTFDTSGCLIQGNDRLIATIGLNDIVIVDTGDALLVCTKDKAQDVKNIVSWLQKNNRADLL